MDKNLKSKFLITTAIDYANDVIHIGQAYEKILADVVARYFRISRDGKQVFFTTGTDEHGTTNAKAAQARDMEPFEHVTDISLKDKVQIDSLNISYDRFFRTTDRDHQKEAGDFFLKAFQSGDIYKSTYEGLYCEGCEAYKTLSELNEAGQCPLHQTREIQKLEEENYFFKWSKYEGFLKEQIEKDELLILPEGKKREMLAFIENGIQDIPITRPKYKLSWGITVPNDPDHVIYVWFDALINYVTSAKKIGFWEDDTTIIHFIGKDVARWHTLLWPAMLKSAGYRIPDVVHVHGFINLDGQKISKSRGNIIRPLELVEKYGVDAIRYYLIKHGPITDDVDISIKHLEEIYNGELANGLGNTVSRVAKLAESSQLSFPVMGNEIDVNSLVEFEPLRETLRADLALINVWQKISDLDKHINEHEPWQIKDGNRLEEVLGYEVDEIRVLTKMLEPFIPDTAQKINAQFNQEKITAEKPLFPRIS